MTHLSDKNNNSGRRVGLTTDTFSAESLHQQEAVALIRQMYTYPVFSDCAKLTRDLLQLQPGDTLLDIGSSYCPDSSELEIQLGSHGKLILVDSSAVALQEAATSHRVTSQFETLCCNAQAIPLGDESVSGARAIRTLQHVMDIEQLLAEVVRVLKPQSRFVIVEPDWSYKRVETSAKLQETVTQLLNDQRSRIKHVDLVQTLPDTLHIAGFNLESHQNVDFETTKPADIEFFGDFSTRITQRVIDGTWTANQADELHASLTNEFGRGKSTLKLRFAIFAASRK